MPRVMPGGVIADAPQATGRRQLRLVRSLLLTPWFAAGAGVVIAAALAVDSPAALTYAPNSPGLRCAASGCVRPSPGHAPALFAMSWHQGVYTKQRGHGLVTNKLLSVTYHDSYVNGNGSTR